ncbi:hypothetical protein [Xanthomonas phaseoli]|uniref:hypothetical protein n=1 Tax=Xanthomonas phaseoli TaxID=1985254 RepID=UPI00031F675F|nr:hypothetical protein [Xanthomonas phaseoli]KUF27255.1 hypothetical protein AO826_07705 [Xanthomonas phaseoli pv. manihotis]MBO9722611.1 hypothetical protein [Xanthomonas phaseoli pv. manihotis]
MSKCTSTLTTDDYVAAIMWAEDAIREDEHVLQTLGQAASASFTTYLQKKIACRKAQLQRFRDALSEASHA